MEGLRRALRSIRKVDPLFTLDLSQPEKPRLVGELKVPGYSEYIHPLDEDHLLTIGKDAEDPG
jgi:inhibitor of cysteine peptidase